MNRTRRLALLALFAVPLIAPLPACVVNPATGQRQLITISEAEEVQLGRQADPAIVAQFGLYDDPAIETHVAGIGRKLAAVSEMPGLGWHFRVLDDPLVNAFALPGGYIYVTRGILAHFNSEAELASVLGHEIGHVTGRHSAEQLSKQQIAGLGAGVASILAPEAMSQAGFLVDTSLGLMFLKFGRNHEREADDLGLRYVMRASYDPRPMADMFRTLRRIGRASGSGEIPNWLSTHPDPGNREGAINDAIAATRQSFAGKTLGRDEYLAKIDGLVFGSNPRHGYFDEQQVFYHPEMQFSVHFPTGWKTQNATSSVSAMSPGQDALIQLALSKQGSAAEALREFLSQQGVNAAGGYNPRLGLPASGTEFTASLQGTAIRGRAIFIEYGGRVFGLVGFAVEAGWQGYAATIGDVLSSFARVTDRRVLDVKPKILRIVRADRAMTLDEFAQRNAATVPIKTLAIINGIWATEPLVAGRSYKVVQGGDLP